MHLTVRSTSIFHMAVSHDTRERIIEVAKKRFHQRSYADVGIKEICDEAHIQKGSFYHFFPSKRDLVLTVIDEFAADWADGFVAEAFDPKLKPMERIGYVIDAAYFWQKSVKDVQGHLPGCLFGNLALEVSTQDNILRAKLNAVFTHAKSRFKDTLDEAVEQGAITPLDTDATAEAMLAFLEGMILIAKAKNDPEVIYRLGPALSTIRIEASNH